MPVLPGANSAAAQDHLSDPPPDRGIVHGFETRGHPTESETNLQFLLISPVWCCCCVASGRGSEVNFIGEIRLTLYIF